MRTCFSLDFLRIAEGTLICRGGMGSKSLHGNMFYKGHGEIAEQATHHFNKALKYI
jgi:hypothetical protein